MGANGAQVGSDISTLLRARNPLLWVVSREEVRVERAIATAAQSAGYQTAFWDVSTGLTRPDGTTMSEGLNDPAAVIDFIRGASARTVYVLRDFHAWLNDPVMRRSVKSLARTLQAAKRENARALVILSPLNEIPPEWTGVATVVEFPLPDRSEMAAILDEAVGRLPPEIKDTAIGDGTRDAAIDAVIGLTADEAASCYARSLVTLKRIDPVMVGAEKKRVVARDRVLTWYDPDPRGFSSVGGLDVLKPWIAARKAAFSPEARTFGLPAPKGILLVGVSGCGKSQVAKAMSAAWGQPLLRLDLGGLKSKYVGESEGNIRKALALAETVAPSILWIDEIDKALAGSTGPQGDGGVSTDALGAILTWMQERTAPVFVVATANDVRGLPPELLRKGRFDEVFFVDLPTKRERAEIVSVAIRQAGRDPTDVDMDAVASATRDFTGAECAAIVPDALFAAFGDGQRKLTTGDLVTAASAVVPLAKTAAEKIADLRQWAKGRARAASTPDAVSAVGAGALDLEA